MTADDGLAIQLLCRLPAMHLMSKRQLLLPSLLKRGANNEAISSATRSPKKRFKMALQFEIVAQQDSTESTALPHNE
jgi:hypothetical protein